MTNPVEDQNNGTTTNNGTTNGTEGGQVSAPPDPAPAWSLSDKGSGREDERHGKWSSQKVFS